MRDPRLDRLADVIVRYSTRVKKDDLVCIAGDPISFPLVEAMFEAVLKAGGHPFWQSRSEVLDELFLAHATEEQLRFLSPLDLHRIDTVDVQISFWAEINTKMMGRADPKRQAIAQATRRPFMQKFLQRAADKKLRWCGTLFPTQSAAQDADRSLREYEDFVFRAGLLHLPDPVAAWRAIHDRQEKVREFLQGKKVLRFQVPPAHGNDGTDLTVDVSKGVWINCAGHENFPDGEVFAGPTGVDGHVNYTFPAVYEGREVHGVRLKFKGGRVVDASATRNEEFLIQMLDQDQGARNLGEIAIGTNYGIQEFTKNTLFDEKIGGTFHAAVGAGYPESGSYNESGLHWDMVCELRASKDFPGGTIEADGEVFHKGGKFVKAGWPGNE
jgi:aminopeptidase